MIKWALQELSNFEGGPDEWSREVPEDWLVSAGKYRRGMDKIASVVGRVLLCGLLRSDGRNPADYQWRSTEFKKPFLLGRDGLIHFSISHSGSMVVCAYSPHVAVGLDLERCTPRPLQSFEKIFTYDEMNFLRNSTNPERAMCEIWTRKEAVAKAAGKGVYLPFGSFSTMRNNVVVEGDTYQINSLEIPSDYMLCAAVKSNVLMAMIRVDCAVRDESVRP